jgi:hypothetical protein
VKTKAITHPLIHDAAERPTGWSDLFFKRVSDVVLPGYTVFSASDARHAAARMLTRGTFRLKKPLGASAKGQTLVTHIDELDAFLETVPSEEMATYGLVLEENLQNVTTLSVGLVTVGPFKMAYHGVQRLVKDNEGRSVYGGSNLVCVRGGWEALENLSVSPQVRSAVAAAKQYDEAMSEYTGFMATRRNYDVGQGFDAKGDTVSGVFESSWRVGGASSAELLALEMLAQDHSLEIVEASHVEKFGKGHDVPPEAIIHFRGDDMEAGPIVRYTVVRRAQRVEDRTIA